MREGWKRPDVNKKILITGAAGFIGFHLSKRLLEEGCHVVGMDNLNDYYDVKLKESRLGLLKENAAFQFILGNIADKEMVCRVFSDCRSRYCG